MKVLHILNALRPSGAEQMLRIAAQFWRDKGCELHILSLEQQPSDFSEELLSEGWSLHFINANAGIFNLCRSVGQVIEQISPHILHIHQEAFSLMLPVIGKVKGIRTFRTVHSNYQFSGFLRARKYLERSISRHMGVHFVSIGSSVEKNEKQRFGNTSELLWNWYDSERFRLPTDTEKLAARAQLGISDESKIIMSVGNSAPVKNYESIIRALALLRDPALIYYQVGHSDYSGKERELVDSLGLADRVQFFGPTDQVLDCLWAADVFVMPSFREGLPLSAAEALAAGCPAVLSDRPGLKDFREVSDSVAWVGTDSNSIARGISQQLDRPPSRDSLAAASERVRLLFGCDVGAERYYNLWIQK